MSGFRLAQTLEKMTDDDKDFRYMACNDLIADMHKDGFTLSADELSKLVKRVLSLITDTSTDVQTVAVKCIGELSKLCPDALMEDVIDALCNQLERTDGSTRDIATLAIKGVLAELTSTSGVAKTIGRKLTPRILKIAGDERSAETQLEALDVLQEMLKKFGAHMSGEHDKSVTLLLALLRAPRSIVRKRAVAALGFLVANVNDKLLADVMGSLLGSVKEKQSKVTVLRVFIQAVSAVSRSAGARLGRYVAELVPVLVRHLESDDGVEEEDAEELCEACLQTVDSFALRNSKEVAPFVQRLLAIARLWIKHDPAWQYDSDEDGDADGEGDDDGGDGGDDDDDDGVYGDDDDVSWKTRRAAAKLLATLVATRQDLVRSLYDETVPAIVARFSEREEVVQSDIFAVFAQVVRQTANLAKHEPAIIEQLAGVMEKGARKLRRQLRVRSQKTRSGVFNILRELLGVRASLVEPYFASFVPGIAGALGDRKAKSALKADSIAFVQAALVALPPSCVQPHVAKLQPLVTRLVRDSYYKISADALRTLGHLVACMRPSDGSGASFDVKPFTAPVYDTVMEKLKVLDVDQEVKDAAMFAMGQVVSRLPAAAAGPVLAIVLERLRNEITRMGAVQALRTIAESATGVDLAPVLDEACKEIADLLRKDHRPLKQATLLALEALVRRHGAKLSPAAGDVVFAEAAGLINEVDQFLAHLSLRVFISSIGAVPFAEKAIAAHAMPRALQLVSCAQLQGVGLDALVAFFGHCSQLATFAVDKFLPQIEAIEGPVAAKVLAELCVRASAGVRAGAVDRLVGKVKQEESLEAKVQGLNALGEIGARVDLSDVAGLDGLVLASLQSPAEQVKVAASASLGGLAIGNLSKYVPLIVRLVEEQPKSQYLLLLALRNVLAIHTRQGGAGLDGFGGNILKVLLSRCASDEESVRNVVAECLGRLALATSAPVVQTVAERIASADAAHVRAALIAAVRFAITDAEHAIDGALRTNMGQFLRLLADADLHVRRAASVTLNSVAHSKPSLCRPCLRDVFPLLMGETKIKKELIREIKVGPFTHKEDDGLPNRKAAFEALFTLLENCSDLLDYTALLESLASGLGDHADIKTLSHMMLEKLAVREPAAVLSAIDSLVEPLQATLAAKLKADAVQQEVDRNEEVVKGALRAIATLARIPDSDSSVKFAEFLNTKVLKGEGQVPDKYAAIVKELADRD